MGKHLNRDLEILKKDLLTLGALVEEALDKAIAALLQRRTELVQEIADGDRRIDELEVELEESCLKVLALHQPVAADLRFIITTLKVNNDLERMGDLAVNIADRAASLAEFDPLDVLESLRENTVRVRSMVRDCLDALVHVDTGKAREVCLLDARVDATHRHMFEVLQELMKTRSERVVQAVHTLSASRNLERIADLATNIAEDVIFMAEGEVVRHRPLDIYGDRGRRDSPVRDSGRQAGVPEA